MILYGMLGYFLLITAGVIVFIRPGMRDRTRQAAGRLLERSWRLLAKLGAVSRGIPGSPQSAGRLPAIPGVLSALLKHPARSLSLAVFLTAPSLAILSLPGSRVFEFDNSASPAEQQVALLLEGERLSPPPPLPPEVFTTQEVEISRPDAVHASRNWQLLDAEFTQRLLVAFRLMEERHGYRMTLLEGYRSPERQARLFAEGEHVTRAKANMSYHQYGLAADSAFFRDGKIVISERDPWAMRGYELFGEIAEQLGLTWGGRWQLRDFGHVELRRRNVLGQAARRESAPNAQHPL
ncbi:MAG: M15 family metallopeptidase [Proteobacteria bacterium]|nr:M15 family metallopeptidase [Pseudomonadota bacterium]